MASKSEDILAALFTAIGGVGGRVERNSTEPEEVPPTGLIILHDGEPGEPEVTMSPLTYGYEHLAAAELIVQGADNDTDFDVLKRALGTAIAADRTLGGLCDWVEAEAPTTEDLPFTGSSSVKAAIVPIRLIYTTSDPLA